MTAGIVGYKDTGNIDRIEIVAKILTVTT